MTPADDDPTAAFEQHVRRGCARATAMAARIQAEGIKGVLPSIRRAWIETELPSRCLDAWTTIWEAVRTAADPRRVMTTRERRQFTALPEVLTVFRGATAGGERGWSWTLDEDVAADFARRYAEDIADDEPCILTASVHKCDVIAYFETGGEHEIILDPRSAPAMQATSKRAPATVAEARN